MNGFKDQREGVHGGQGAKRVLNGIWTGNAHSRLDHCTSGVVHQQSWGDWWKGRGVCGLMSIDKMVELRNR